MKRLNFYAKIVSELISDKEASVLICGGGTEDKQVFEELGFPNVTISNLDSRMDGKVYHPFKWDYQNAENLSYNDNSFDFVVIHAAIYHASSPHKVLTEMYRVASKAMLAFESRDSVIIRLLQKLKITQTYEHAAVYYNDCKYGGVNNTEIPNYIYRWTEREIEKTIKSYSPVFRHNFTYRYGTDFPATVQLEKKANLKSKLLDLFKPLYSLFVKIFPKQQNLFAFYIEKPDKTGIFPWLKYSKEQDKITFNKEWASKIYKTF